MRVRVDNTVNGPIEGVARDAAIAARGGGIEIAITKRNVIRLPRVSDVLALDGGTAAIVRIQRGSDSITLFCTKD